MTPHEALGVSCGATAAFGNAMTVEIDHLFNPWLAALIVVPESRNRGVGRALCRAGAAHAQRLGIREVFLGTEMPAFYAQLGAEVYEQVTDTLCIMRVRLP